MNSAAEEPRCTHCDQQIVPAEGFLSFGDTAFFHLDKPCITHGLELVAGHILELGFRLSPQRGHRSALRLPWEKP